MKTRFIVILAIQTILMLMFLIFSFYQQSLAEAARGMAVSEATRADAALALARANEEKATLLAQQLEDCK